MRPVRSYFYTRSIYIYIVQYYVRTVSKKKYKMREKNKQKAAPKYRRTRYVVRTYLRPNVLGDRVVER